MKPEETFDFQLRKTWMAIAKMYNDIMTQAGLTMSIGQVLINLDVHEGTPSTALGPKMGMESTSLSRLLKNMEGQGLIYKEAHPSDKRSVLLKLTEKGLQMRDLSRNAVLEFNSTLTSELTSEEQKRFFTALSKINATTERVRESNKKTTTQYT